MLIQSLRIPTRLTNSSGTVYNHNSLTNAIVLITHDHYDHLEAKTIKYLAEKDIQFIIPPGVGAR